MPGAPIQARAVHEFVQSPSALFGAREKLRWTTTTRLFVCRREMTTQASLRFSTWNVRRPFYTVKSLFTTTMRYTVKAMIIIHFESNTGGSTTLAHRLIVTLTGGFGEPCESLWN